MDTLDLCLRRQLHVAFLATSPYATSACLVHSLESVDVCECACECARVPLGMCPRMRERKRERECVCVYV